MLADPKELAEHVMLVDLARNDVGRVTQYGTVNVDELMAVERYSHVMHIVSGREAATRDRPGRRLACHLPARDGLGRPEGARHGDHRPLGAGGLGPYAGAVGYLDLSGTWTPQSASAPW